MLKDFPIALQRKTVIKCLHTVNDCLFYEKYDTSGMSSIRTVIIVTDERARG